MRHSPIRPQNCDSFGLEPVDDGKGLDEDGRACNERSIDENADDAISLPAFQVTVQSQLFHLGKQGQVHKGTECRLSYITDV